MMNLIRLLFASIVAAGIPALAAEDPPDLKPILNRPPAPDFALPGPDGTLYRLADYRGRPIILNFWATWCPPCRAEMPALQRAHAAVAGEGIAVLAINVGEDAEAVAGFLAQSPVDFPLPIDGDTKVAQRYSMRGLPTTYVIDPAGRLVFSAIGEQPWDDPRLLDQVRALKSP